MRVKIWPGKWKHAWASGILYRLYKRLPSSGECQKILVSQPEDITHWSYCSLALNHRYIVVFFSRLTIGLSVSLGLLAIELGSFLGGVSMFMPTQSMLCILEKIYNKLIAA